MTFVKRQRTPAKMERRRRLLLVLPEVAEELKRKRGNRNLTGKEIKEIDSALLAIASFEARLKLHETTNDCHLGRIIGSKAVGSVYYAATGARNLASFLDGEYAQAEEAFAREGMEVPLVLQEIYKQYTRVGIPADDKDACVPAPCKVSDC